MYMCTVCLFFSNVWHLPSPQCFLAVRIEDPSLLVSTCPAPWTHTHMGLYLCVSADVCAFPEIPRFLSSTGLPRVMPTTSSWLGTPRTQYSNHNQLPTTLLPATSQLQRGRLVEVNCRGEARKCQVKLSIFLQLSVLTTCVISYVEYA